MSSRGCVRGPGDPHPENAIRINNEAELDAWLNDLADQFHAQILGLPDDEAPTDTTKEDEQ